MTATCGRDVAAATTRPIEKMVHEYWKQEDRRLAHKAGPAGAAAGGSSGGVGSAPVGSAPSGGLPTVREGPDAESTPEGLDS